MSDYPKAYRELYEIFKYMPHEEVGKIPKAFLNKIEEKMDQNYEYKVIHIKDFQNQNMLRETRAILAVLYRDYWADEEEKARIKNQEQIEFLNQEKQKNEKYNNDVFLEKRKAKEEKIIEKEAEKALIVYKENFLKKIIKKIVSFLKK